MQLQITARIARGRNVAVNEMAFPLGCRRSTRDREIKRNTFHRRDPPDCHSEGGAQRAAQIPIFSGA